MKTRSFVVLALLPAAIACNFPRTSASAPPLTAEAAKKATETIPGTTEESLRDGHDYFAARCNGCHGYPDLTSIATSRWPEIIEKMGSKANLDKVHSEEVLHYIQAVAPRSVMRTTWTPTAY